MKTKPPEWYLRLAPELLIHPDWEHMPPPPPPWWERAGSRLHDFIAGERWRSWSVTDWLYALMFLSIGVGIAAELMRVVYLAKQATH